MFSKSVNAWCLICGVKCHRSLHVEFQITFFESVWVISEVNFLFLHHSFPYSVQVFAVMFSSTLTKL